MSTTNISIGLAAITASWIFRKPIQRFITSLITRITTIVALQFLYMGYTRLAPSAALEKRDTFLNKYGGSILDYKNKEGKSIDTVRLLADPETATGNVVVFAANKPYQCIHPKNFEPFLANGADVVFFNPTQLGGPHYSQDLYSVLKGLSDSDSTQQIVVRSYCASVDPSIKAVADMQRDNIHIIVDRGYGDVGHLARNLTRVASLSCIQSTLEKNFSCKGIDKISEIAGSVLCIVASHDQIMNYGDENLTNDLYKKRQSSSKPTHLLTLQDHGHWGRWEADTFTKVLQILSEKGIVKVSPQLAHREKYPKNSLNPFQKKCLPLLIQRWI